MAHLVPLGYAGTYSFKSEPLCNLLTIALTYHTLLVHPPLAISLKVFRRLLPERTLPILMN